MRKSNPRWHDDDGVDDKGGQPRTQACPVHRSGQGDHRGLGIGERAQREIGIVTMEHSDEVMDRLPRHPALVVLDFDGVLTDNMVYVDQDGIESVRCSKADSQGIGMVRQAGVPVVILSSEKNPVVSRRAEKLGIPCIQGVTQKIGEFRRLVAEYDVEVSDVVYVGNDANDIDCLRDAGCGLVVADAHRSAIAVADGVLSYPGGRGAVRELCDAILLRLASSRSPMGGREGIHDRRSA